MPIEKLAYILGVYKFTLPEAVCCCLQTCNVYILILMMGLCIKFYRSKSLHTLVNPRRACAARVAVLGLSVCLSVCPSLFSHYRQRRSL